MAKELTVTEKLRQLYELQTFDSEIDEIQVLKGELPVEVSDLEDEIEGLETRVNRLKTAVNESEQEVARQKAAASEAVSLIERYKKQLDNVKNSREFEALTKEIENQELEIQLTERKINQALKEIEAKSELLGVADERMKKKMKELETKQVELREIIEKTEKEEERLRKRSEKMRKNIEERLIKAYDKIRSSYRNGLAVVTVERNSCGGCFNKIPPQMQLEIAMRKKIVACEHCGRILVDDYILEGDAIDGAREMKESMEA
jgi:predicted  nucleic acid-binding Zn-ribbon protein